MDPSLDTNPDHDLSRVRSEYLEMPCLRLTVPQAARLFGVSVGLASRLLTQLAHEGIVRQLVDGRFARRT